MHALRPLFDNWAAGDQPFAGITAASALGTLRAILVTLQVKDAESYRCHDLRRGHAKDLQQSGWVSTPSLRSGEASPLLPSEGAPLYQILAAGEWRSPAFLQYLDIHQLERDAVIQAHCDESEEDDL